MNYSVIGIDPGAKGGLALLTKEGVIEYSLMPNTVHGIVAWFDAAINGCQSLPVVVIERAQAMPKQGITSAFNYGRHFGTFEAIATCYSLPYHEVRPAAWKKDMGLNAAKIDSIKLCQRLFPSVNLIPDGCRTAKDGIAEAVLIAEWGRRKVL